MFTRIASRASRGPGQRPTGRSLAAALCAAFVAGASATAHAESVSDSDTVGDMVTFNDDDAVVLAPGRTLNDVSNTKLRHGTRRIAVRADYVDLKRRAGGEYQSVGILMVTNEGVRRTVSLDAWQGHWSGESQMYNGKHNEVECAVRHSIDYEANIVKMNFSRRCASNPRWMRFSVWAQSNGDDGYYGDDALRDGPITSQAGDLKWSQRVHREPAS